MSAYLEKLIARAKNGRSHGLWDDTSKGYLPAPDPTEKNSVTRDAFDKRAWDYITDQLPVLKGQVGDLEEEFPTSPAAYEDLFSLLNQGDPRFEDPKKVLPEYRPQRAIVEGLEQAEDLKHVRKATRYDDFETALAIMTMQDRMRQAFEDLKDVMDAMQAAQEALDNAIAQGEQALQDGSGQEAAGQSIEEAIQQMLQAQGASEQQAQEMAQALAEGLKEAREGIERREEQAASYGLQDGDMKRLDFEERRRLTEQFDRSKIAHMADLIGQFRRFADAERRRKIVHAPAEKYDVELGNNLSKLVQSELDHMAATPELEDLFWLKYAKQGLMQWKVRGNENAGKGPIIVVCDESGSMTCGLDQAGNTREMWAKATSLALADQARRSKRDFIYIGFSSASQQREVWFPNGEQPVEKIHDMVERFFGGGTAYEQPLGRAMEIIRQYLGHKKALPDVVFITDDECYVTDEFVNRWQEDRRAAGVQCYGLQVGGGSGYKNAMGRLADKCMTIDRLTAGPEALTELFRTI